MDLSSLKCPRNDLGDETQLKRIVMSQFVLEFSEHSLLKQTINRTICFYVSFLSMKEATM